MARKLKDLTVFIGRFSPFHLGHAAVLRRALQTSKVVLVLIGSSGQARTTKNPFTFDERREMIMKWEMGIEHDAYVRVRPITDHPYNDAAWIRGVQDAVDTVKNELVDVIGINPEIYLTGADRDRTTWYLHAFGNTFKPDFVENLDVPLELSATKVREVLFGGGPVGDIMKSTPDSTFRFLTKFAETETWGELVKEFEFIKKYKEAWASAPYAPSFLTVDACVIQSGHVLVNVRDNFPGKGLWALPGGFLEPTERAIDGAVRELMEETSIELSKAQLYGSIKSKENFDHPERSLRGRTFTVCYLFVLDDTKPLPKVKPQKGEVRKIMWVPIAEALRRTDMWFEDHHAMLTTMYGRVGTSI